MASIERRKTKQGIRYRVRITLKGQPHIRRHSPRSVPRFNSAEELATALHHNICVEIAAKAGSLPMLSARQGVSNDKRCNRAGKRHRPLSSTYGALTNGRDNPISTSDPGVWHTIQALLGACRQGTPRDLVWSPELTCNIPAC